MTKEFLVRSREILLFEEADFLGRGGEEVHFGSLSDDVVTLVATGPADAIGWVARAIVAHGTVAA